MTKSKRSTRVGWDKKESCGWYYFAAALLAGVGIFGQGGQAVGPYILSATLVLCGTAIRIKAGKASE